MKKNSIFKIIGFAVGACAGIAVVGAIKQKIDDEKHREAEIEAEISAIIEQKWADRQAFETAEEEQCL